MRNCAARYSPAWFNSGVPLPRPCISGLAKKRTWSMYRSVEIALGTVRLEGP